MLTQNSKECHYKVIIQLRRKFWSFMRRWLTDDFFDCFIENHTTIDFIGDKLYVYKWRGIGPPSTWATLTVVPLSLPSAFETAASKIIMIMGLSK